MGVPGREDWTIETSRDYLVMLIKHETEMRETTSRQLATALAIQATETLRRLDELNHAHALAAQNWSTSLPRELFEQWRDEQMKWKETVNGAVVMLAAVHGRAAAVDTRIAVIETMANKVTGALWLMGIMGFMGVLAFLLGLARLGGLVR